MDNWRLLELMRPIGLLCAVAALVIYWIQRQRYYRRLRSLGLKSEDLKSQLSINRKLGEIVTSRLPERIEFEAVKSHSWSNQEKHVKCEQALAKNGFERIGVFAAKPRRWIAEFWVRESLASCAVVIDSKVHGPYLELVSSYEDGTHASFVNHPNTGLCELDDQHVHCGYIPPDELIARWLRERPGKQLKPATSLNSVKVYEETANSHLERLRKNGISAEQIRRFFEFRRKYKTTTTQP